MIKIAERLKAQAQTNAPAGEDRAAALMHPMPAQPESQVADQGAAYPAKNLVLDGGRYYAAGQEK